MHEFFVIFVAKGLLPIMSNDYLLDGLMNYFDLLQQRLRPPRNGWLDVDSTLAHFALITYAIPMQRLAAHIPQDRFEIATFDVGSERRALISAVPFIDADFRFRVVPFARFGFGQTNYRAYVINKYTGQHGVWFFGTTLGSWVVNIARALWRIPWHSAQYAVDCVYDAAQHRYTRYAMQAQSRWSALRVHLEDSGQPLVTHAGFESMDAMRLILTHPVDGYFYRLDGALGSYSVWHEVLPLTEAKPTDAYFGVFERLGLLSREEMLHPLSSLVCPTTQFRVLLPPHLLH